MSRVHFATNNSTDYFTMPDASEKNNAVDEGTMLRMNPSEAIVFQSSGSEMIGTVEISNADSNTVAYKIKTTSPEKYRVRPSTGILTPGASACINVVLQQGQDISTLNRDKFLVMCTEFDTSNKQDLSEFWKLLPNNSAAVEQHRLKCSLPLNAMNGNGAEMKNLSFNDSLNVDGDNRESVNLLKSMHQLHNSIHRLESQLKFNRTLQWITLVTFFLLTLAIIYLLKMEIQNNSVEYCSMKRE